MRFIIKTAGLSDVGLKRKENEDAFHSDDLLGLYIVADGMGGHQAGEVASRIAVDLINKAYRLWQESETPIETLFNEPDTSISASGNYILSGIRLANRVIHELASCNSQYKNMGTTVAALVIKPQQIISANVGDSRIYLIRNGKIKQLSADHSVVAEQVSMGIMSPEEAGASPLKHVLTRNLGAADSVDVHINEIEPKKNDRLILCSDGLTDLISDEEIKHMVEAENSPDVLCHSFIDAALRKGGNDNATVISVFLSEMNEEKTGLLHKFRYLFSR